MALFELGADLVSFSDHVVFDLYQTINRSVSTLSELADRLCKPTYLNGVDPTKPAANLVYPISVGVSDLARPALHLV